MVDRGDHHLSGKTVLSPTHNTDESQEHHHLEDNISARDKHTTSPNSIESDCDNNLFLDKKFPKNLDKD